MVRLSRITGVILVLIAAGACNDEPLQVSSGASAVEPQANVTGGPNDIAAIQEIMNTFDRTWGSDPVTYAAQYADADFIGPTGAHLTTPAQITGLYTFLFNGVFAGTTRTSTIANLTFLTGTLAVLDIDARGTGFTSLPPGVVPWAPGIVRAREKNVLMKRGGEWRIILHQQTSVAPGVL
jgi:hypothetical protein